MIVAVHASKWFSKFGANVMVWFRSVLGNLLEILADVWDVLNVTCLTAFHLPHGIEKHQSAGQISTTFNILYTVHTLEGSALNAGLLLQIQMQEMERDTNRNRARERERDGENKKRHEVKTAARALTSIQCFKMAAEKG